MTRQFKRSFNAASTSILHPLERRVLMASTPISDFSPPDSGLSGPFFTVGGATYYAYNDGWHGYELWKRDAANPDGRLLKDINAVRIDAMGRTAGSGPAEFFAFNGLVLFIASDGAHGRELWRTDGTTGGTYLLADLRQGFEGAYGMSYLPYKGRLLINAGRELLYTDGTSAGTRNLGMPGDKFFEADGTLYFAHGTINYEVHSFDGTTVLRVPTHPIGTSSRNYGGLHIRSSDGALVYTWSIYVQGPSRPGTSGEDVIISSGASPVTFSSVRTQASISTPGRATGIGTFNGLAYFPIYQHGLWVSDGTQAGLRQVLADEQVGQMFQFNGHVCFTVRADNRFSLWSTDGTAAGTAMVLQIDQQERFGFDYRIVNGRLVFTARSLTGYEIRSWDGVSATSEFIASADSSSLSAVVSNDRLFFSRFDSATRVGEGWISDGTAAGTSIVYRRTVNVGVPRVFLPVINGRYLVRWHDYHTNEIIDSSRVFAATTMAYPRAVASHVAMADETSYLLVKIDRSGPDEYELWMSDGSDAGTLKVANLPDANEYAVRGTFGGVQLFSSENQIWRSDGTPEGTYKLLDAIHAGTLATVGSTHFLVADNGTGRALWKTDGTVAGTVMVKSFGPGFVGTISGAKAVASQVFFFSEDALNGRHLWRSDGTEAGTHVIKPSDATGSAVTSLPLLAGNGVLLAGAFTPADGPEIFILDLSSPPPGPQQAPAPLLSGGVLRIFGTGDNDTISVVRNIDDLARLDVAVNGLTYAFPFADVSRIRVFADAGDDWVDAITPIATSVMGGAGNDTIKTGAGRDTLYGEDGDDALYGGANTDWLFGGAGNDRLNGGGGRDILWGGTGRDTFVSSVGYERRDFDLDDLLR